jgi:hypothetical protein
MPQAQPSTAQGLPRWLIVCGSAVITYHLLSVGLMALAAPSGPWPSMEGVNLSTPPQFAYSLQRALTADYSKALKLTHNYHFTSNRPGLPGAYFEVRLKDAAGREVETVRVPDPGATSWVRHQQALLARRLADDEPVAPPQGETIAAPHRQVPNVQIWDIVDNRKLKLKSVPMHLVPRDRMVFRPSDWSLLLARSYGRYLCRLHGAATAEIIRHTEDPLPPAVLFEDNQQAGAFGELVSNFGELPR